MSPLLAVEMTSAGFKAAHWSAVGAFNTTDPELMAYAAQHGYVVVTHDLDFGAILAASGTKAPSAVQVRAYNFEVKDTAHLLVVVLKQSARMLEQGALLILDTSRSRVRVLSLTRL